MNTTRGSLLLRLRRSDDTRAWTDFDALYRPILHHFALARGVSDEAAEDLVQQCLTIVSQEIGRFDYDRGKGRFRTWLLTIMERRVIDLLRRREPITADSAWLNSLRAPDPTPEETFERIWMVEHLRYLLEEIRCEVEPSTYRAFQLYVLESIPADEVCRSLSMNRAQLYTIKWRITRMIEHRLAAMG